MLKHRKELAELPGAEEIIHDLGSRIVMKRLKEPITEEEVSHWLIPGPIDRIAYSAQEIADMFGKKLLTIRHWIVVGLKPADGDSDALVRLQTLRMPRGRITPAALCAFLGAVNGVRVKVKEPQMNADGRRGRQGDGEERDEDRAAEAAGG
jgi:hypothetical protein